MVVRFLLFSAMLPGLVSIVSAEELPPLFLTQSVSDNAPFVGRQVLYTLELYSRVRISEPSLHVSHEGFNEYVLGQDTRDETVKGARYQITRLRSILYPEYEGRVEIPAQRVEVTPVPAADSSVGPRTVLETLPVTVIVRPLPPHQQPEQGILPPAIVGNTSASIEFNKAPLNVGETRSLKIIVRSEGDLSPLIMKLSGTSGLRVYESPSVLNRLVSPGSFMLEKVFSYDIMPLNEGLIVISTGSFFVFDLLTQGYLTKDAGEIQIQAVKAQTASSALPMPALAEKTDEKGEVQKERLRYHEANAMERLLSRLSASSLLLFAVSLSLAIMTVRIHLNARRVHRAEAPSFLDDLRRAETMADLHRNFREALLTAVAEESEEQGLKQILKASISDSDQRLQVEAFLNDLAVEVYSAKEPSAKKFKVLKQRALRTLEAVHKPG